MIDWNIKNSQEKRPNWYFPSFEVQEYLLPIIYVGGEPIDEYGDTLISPAECQRMKNSIKFIQESLLLSPKSKIRYETMQKGLVVLDKLLVLKTLEALGEATDMAVLEQKSLVFFGD